MERFVPVAVMLALMLAMAGCGPRQGATGPPAPDPIVAESRECPSPIVGENLRVTSAIGESNSPVISWNGNVFPIAWWDMRGRFPSVHVARIDRAGVHRAPALQMPNQGNARGQSVASDSASIHVVWSDERQVLSARLGHEEREQVVIAEQATSPAAGPWGAAAWVFKGNLLFRCDGMLPPSSREGLRAEPEPVVLGRGGIEDVAVAWSGKYFAVVWSESVKGGREITMQRVSGKGNRAGLPVRVSAVAGTNRKPVIAWSGSEYAVAWTNAAPKGENPRDSFRIFVAVVPAAADKPRLTRQLEFQGSADQVALAATGKEFAVAWVGSKEPMGSAIYFRRLDIEGMPLGETIRVTDDKPLTCGRPSLVWAGDGYGVTWHDDREPAGSEVFFSFVSCGDAAEQPVEAPAADAGPPAADEPATAEEPVLKDVF
jgi:hypothetical protein